MSGWGFDSSSLGQFARSAISTATKQIDKVLDIDETQDPTGREKLFSSTTSSTQSSTRTEAKSSSPGQSQGSFWDAWETKLSTGKDSDGDGPGWSHASLNSSSTSASESSAPNSGTSRKSLPSSKGTQSGSAPKSPSRSSEPLRDDAALGTKGRTGESTSTSGGADVASVSSQDKPGTKPSGARGTGKKTTRSRRSGQQTADSAPAGGPSSSTTAPVSTKSADQCAVVTTAPSETGSKAAGLAEAGKAQTGQHEGPTVSGGVSATGSTPGCEGEVSAEVPARAAKEDLPSLLLTEDGICTVGAASPVLETVSASPRSIEQAVMHATAADTGTSSRTTAGKQRKTKAMALGGGKAKSSTHGKSASSSPTTSAANPAEESQSDVSLPNTPLRPSSGRESAAATAAVVEPSAHSSTALPDSSTPLKALLDSSTVAPDISPISSQPGKEPVRAYSKDSTTLPPDTCHGKAVAEAAMPDSVTGAGKEDQADGWGERNNWEPVQDAAEADDAKPLQPHLSNPLETPPSSAAAGESHQVSLRSVSVEATPSDTPWTASEPGVGEPPTVGSHSGPASDQATALGTSAPDDAAASTASSSPGGETGQPSVPHPSSSPDTVPSSDAGDLVTTESTRSRSATSLPAAAVLQPALLASDDSHPPDEELAQCRHVLSIREDKIMELSRANIDLQETNSILRSQLDQVESAQLAASADVDRVTAEFTERLAEMERRFQKKAHECDQLRRERDSLAVGRNPDSRSHYEKMLREKDESIEGLMAEGQKLSKQHLQQSNMIKKLRGKEKELDQQATALGQELSEAKKSLKKVQEEKKETEATAAKIQDSLMKVNTVAEKQAKELATVKSSLEDEEEKVRGSQSALDNVYKELAALQKEKASNQSAAQEVALEAEVQARRGLKQELEKCRSDALTQQEGLLLQITDLRATITRTEQLSSRREDHLKQEISDLHGRLQEAEGHSQDLTNSVSGATRPLLRQIENLQNSHSAQMASWEKLERNLTERLADAQSQLAEVTEHDRLMSERASELQTRLSTVESSSASSRQDKARLSAELELLRTRFDTIEEDRATAVAKLEALRSSYHQEMEGLRRDKVALNQHLENERSTATAERKRSVIAEERLEKERQRHQKVLSDLRESQPTPQSAASTPSVGNYPLALPNQGDILEESLHGSRSMRRPSMDSPDGSSISDSSFRGLPLTIGMEHLQSLLKQREGEVSALQSQVALLEKARSSVSDQLVAVAAENEELQGKAERVPALKRQVEELDKRYNTMLQMYGEQAERANELRLDLDDVKSMYKQQIQDLLMRGYH